jgi:hypothetical protein
MVLESGTCSSPSLTLPQRCQGIRKAKTTMKEREEETPMAIELIKIDLEMTIK